MLIKQKKNKKIHKSNEKKVATKTGKLKRWFVTYFLFIIVINIIKNI